MFTLDQPRDPQTWPAFTAQPVPEWTMDPEVLARAVSGLAKSLVPGLVAHAKGIGISVPAQADNPHAELAGDAVIRLVRDISKHYFPQLT